MKCEFVRMSARLGNLSPSRTTTLDQLAATRLDIGERDLLDLSYKDR